MLAEDVALRALIRAIVDGDDHAAADLLAASEALARARVKEGATRQAPTDSYLTEINHYVYAGDTALHVAAAGYRRRIAQSLLATGADVAARNRRGAEPLHYAADGVPGSPAWDPEMQADTISCLIDSGADPNAVDKSGVTPLHRAIRTRCAAAVAALLDGGADVSRVNGSGSTPLQLAMWTTGRGGSGTVEAKSQQAQIVHLLQRHGASE